MTDLEPSAAGPFRPSTLVPALAGVALISADHRVAGFLALAIAALHGAARRLPPSFVGDDVNVADRRRSSVARTPRRTDRVVLRWVDDVREQPA